jgi:hypothetical protein
MGDELFQIQDFTIETSDSSWPGVSVSINEA